MKTIAVFFLMLMILCPGQLGFGEEREETIYAGEIQLLSFEDLAYPSLARVARIQGLVIVKARLDDNGNVVDATAISGAKPLISDSLANIRKWKFKPNSHRAVVVVYDFRLDEGGCNDDKRSLFTVRGSNLASITACTPVVGG